MHHLTNQHEITPLVQPQRCARPPGAAVLVPHPGLGERQDPRRPRHLACLPGHVPQGDGAGRHRRRRPRRPLSGRSGVLAREPPDAWPGGHRCHDRGRAPGRCGDRDPAVSGGCHDGSRRPSRRLSRSRTPRCLPAWCWRKPSRPARRSTTAPGSAPSTRGAASSPPGHPRPGSPRWRRRSWRGATAWPATATGPATDSKVVDAQFGYEHAFNALVGLAARPRLLSGIGDLQTGVASCLEALVVDDEVLNYAFYALSQRPWDEDALDIEAMVEGVLGGHGFLGTKHTRRYIRSEFVAPHAELSRRA